MSLPWESSVISSLLLSHSQAEHSGGHQVYATEHWQMYMQLYIDKCICNWTLTNVYATVHWQMHTWSWGWRGGGELRAWPFCFVLFVTLTHGQPHAVFRGMFPFLEDGCCYARGLIIIMAEDSPHITMQCIPTFIVVLVLLLVSV